MPPTAQKMPLALHVHQTIASVVSAIPMGVSIGMTMPTREVATRGRRQYPTIEADRANVRDDEPEEEVGSGVWPIAVIVDGSVVDVVVIYPG